MITTTKKSRWILAVVAAVTVVAAVATGLAFTLTDDDADVAKRPITDPKQGLLQASDFPDGYKLETAGTERGPANIGTVTPPDCARATAEENRQNVNKVGVTQFSEPPTPNLPRYQHTVLMNGPDVTTFEASARACPRYVETGDSAGLPFSVTVTLLNSIRQTPSNCPENTLIVSTRSEMKAAGTSTRDFMTSYVQNGRFLSRLTQEWSAPAQPDIDALCRVTTAALQRLST